MTTSVTLRLPNSLLKEVTKVFTAKNKSKSLISALEKAVEYEKAMEAKMANDYASIKEEDLDFVKQGQKFSKEVIKEDFSEYLKHI